MSKATAAVSGLIIGLGVDIVHIPRIEKLFLKYVDRFLQRAFHSNEIQQFHKLMLNGRKSEETSQSGYLTYSPVLQKPFQFLASRWAIKESTYKALGGTIRLPFPDVHVEQNSFGKPTLITTGKAQELLLQLGVKNSLVSISHDKEFAIANVILQQ